MVSRDVGAEVVCSSGGLWWPGVCRSQEGGAWLTWGNAEVPLALACLWTCVLVLCSTAVCTKMC